MHIYRFCGVKSLQNRKKCDRIVKQFRRDVRAVECARLESGYALTGHRRFKSCSLRQQKKTVFTVKQPQETTCGCFVLKDKSMLNLNVKFQEEYKRLDKLCKDYLSGTEGVSEYIREMESTPLSDSRYSNTWDYDYKKLKRIRWIRNQLAHEVGTLNSDICTEDDLRWTCSFIDRILHGEDPFSTVRKEKNAEAIRKKQQKQAAGIQHGEIQAENNIQNPEASNAKQSLWGKIKSFFANLFDF